VLSSAARAGTAPVFYVNQNAPATTRNDGSSWANAYRELRDALASPAASSGTAGNPVQIWVARGTYKPTGDTNRLATFALPSHVRIYGGFAGNEVSLAQRVSFRYPVVLSGDIGTPQLNPITDQTPDPTAVPANTVNVTDDPGWLDNSCNVLTCINATDVRLDQVTVANGCAYATDQTVGFIWNMTIPQTNSDGTVASDGSTATPLDRRVAGGGLFFQNAYTRAPGEVQLALNNCIFANNMAGGYGGAVAGREARLVITGTTFSGNQSWTEGGAFFGQNHESFWTSCTFLNNVSSGDGGAGSFMSLPSDKMEFGFNDPGFADSYGITPDQMRQRIGYALTALSMVKRIWTLADTAKNLTGTTFARGLFPKNPFKSFDPVTEETVGVGDRIGAAYAWITIAVTAVDIGVMIAEACGVSADDPFVKGWDTFFDGFQTYATPQGIGLLLSEKIVEAIDAGQGGQSDTLAQQSVKQFEEFQFNPTPVSSILIDCAFSGNASELAGGALSFKFDNPRIEDCTFASNTAIAEGGAVACTGFNTPIIMSSAFFSNFCVAGASAIYNSQHAQSQIINCTIVNNGGPTNSNFAVAVELGAEVQLANSILWGNTNSSNPHGGADILTATYQTLLADPSTNGLTGYNQAGAARGDFLGITDISHCDIQSLGSLPVGVDNIPLFGTGPYTQQQIDQVLTNYAAAQVDGLLAYHGFINVGYGNRPGFLTNGNISVDPMLANNVIPQLGSPVLNAGSNLRLNNAVLSSLTGRDLLGDPRVVGSAVDIGAVEGVPPGQGRLIYVRQGATGDNSGSSWDNAMTNLQSALNVPDAQVWVAGGTYYPSLTGDRTASFHLTNGAAVYGGFAGTETSLLQRDIAGYPTILSGNIGDPNRDDDNSYSVMLNTSIGPDTLLDGFTITKGRGTDGAGIYNRQADPTIQNCTFIDNQVSGSGAALYLNAGADGQASTLTHCTFLSNVAGTFGGGVLGFAPFRMGACSFTGNRAGNGGGIYLDGAGVVSIYDCLCVSNSVTGYGSENGGALLCRDTQANIYNTVFFGNRATLTSGGVPGGGAVEYDGSTAGSRIINSIFWQNSVSNPFGGAGTLEAQQISLGSGASVGVSYNIIAGLSAFNTPGSSNLNTDPFFVNPSGGDFHLKAYSPAIDVGQYISDGPVSDLNLNPRWIGPAVDLGAYEFQGTPQSLLSLLVVSAACDGSGGIFQIHPYAANTASFASYQWQVSQNGGNTFTPVTDGGVYSGSATATLTITHPPLTMNGYQYRLQGSDGNPSQPVILRLSPPILYVKAGATGSGSGLDWADAFTTLQTALNVAGPCSQIWVAAGNYFPSASGDVNAAFALRSGIAVYGGFAGNETQLSQRNWLAHPTILNGQVNGTSDNTAGSHHLFVNDASQPGTSCDNTAVLDGFTLFGAVNGSIKNVAASPTINNCVFIDDQGLPYGSILNVSGSAPVLGNCVFAQFPFVVCDTGGGASFSVAFSNVFPGGVTWQVNTGSGFVAATGPNYAVNNTSYSSTLLVSDFGNSTPQFRFAAAGNYASPGLSPDFASPTVQYVNAAAVSGVNNGSSWANAFTNLQSALAQANGCVELWVARGTYAPAAGSSFQLKSGVAILGGFAGTETNVTQRNWQANATILRQSGPQALFFDDGTVVPVDSSAILDGFVITGLSGTALNNHNANPTVRNCTFSNNSGICIDNQSTFSTASHPTILSCVFSNNIGAPPIHNQNSGPAISGCLFVNNQALVSGGGIYNQGSSPTVTLSTFAGNSAAWGGAIYNDTASSCNVSRCVFQNNSSLNGGGALLNGGFGSALDNCLFDGNSTTFRGGAIANWGTGLSLLNCTFAYNQATVSGGGLYNNDGAAVTARNCIFWGNTSDPNALFNPIERGQVDNGSGNLQISYSIIQGLSTYTGNGNLAYDPLFANAFAGNFALGPFSPGINAGNSAGVPAGAVDLPGNPRIFAASIDMGAYEDRNPSPPQPILLTSEPAPTLVCAGNSAHFSISSAPGSNYSFMWLVVTNGVAFPPQNGGQYTITTTANGSTLDIANVDSKLAGALVQVQIGNNYALPGVPITVTQPSVLYVNGNIATAGNGASWAGAFANVADALAAAGPCTELWVTAGTYWPTNRAGRPLTLQMKSGVGIYGGFVGTETLRSQRNWSNNATVFVAPANGGLFVNNGWTTAIDSTAVLDGVTITGGAGPAMANQGASPTVQNCTFRGMSGNAVNNFSPCAPTFINCRFLNIGNVAMLSEKASPMVTSCVFSNNQAQGRGGAMNNQDANATIVACQFINNSAEQGGAVSFSGGASVVSRCTFSGNTASEGGALFGGAGTQTVSSCLFYSNSASQDGGALTVNGSGLTLRNCTISGNSSPQGGGGGLALAAGQTLVRNSIFWQNTDRNGPTKPELNQIYAFGGSAQVVNTCVQGLSQYAGSGNLRYDPLFTNPDGGDFTINTSSPCINAGNNAYVDVGSLDLAGNPRISDGIVDMGALEGHSSTFGTIDLLAGPASVAVCSGSTATLTILAVSTSVTNFQWQVGSTNNFQNLYPGGHYSILSTGATNSTLVISNTDSSLNGLQYRIFLPDFDYLSAPATLTVAPPQIIYVNAAATGAQNGTSWANAFTNLQTAVESAGSCSQVWVAKGTYTPGKASDGSYSFEMKSGVPIYGGFAGNETNLAQRNWTSNVALLLGSSRGPLLQNVGLFVPIDNTAVLDGFTLTGASGQAGIYNVFASPIIRNCQFAGNPYFAMQNAAGSPIIQNCGFSNGTYTAVFNTGGSAPVISNCVFCANRTSNGGAAIQNLGATPLITHCLFTGNSSGDAGGAVEDDGQSQSLWVNCRFLGNSAYVGGAVMSVGSTSTFINCLLANNSSSSSGGGIYVNSATVGVTNCTIAYNQSQQDGGGIYQASGTLGLGNTILWGNTAGNSPSDAYAAQIKTLSGVQGITYSDLQGFTGPANNNTGYDPTFLDPANGNFQLNGNDSPVADKGNNAFVNGITVDLADVARIQGFSVDMGAYEISGGATTQPALVLASPASQTVCVNSTASYTIQVDPSSPRLNSFWEYNPNDGSGWHLFAISGNNATGPALGLYSVVNTSTTSTLTVLSIAPGMNGYQFRVTWTAASFTYRTPSVFLNVTPPTTIYVNAGVAAGGDGSSWATAYPDLATALNAVQGCRNVIWVAAGTYYPTNVPAIPQGTQIYGGFAGNETSLNQRNWEIHPTIFDASGTGSALSLSGQITPLGTNTIVDGLVLQRATLAAVLVNQASPIVRNCVMRNSGTGILLQNNSSPLVQNCQMLQNTGGAYVYNGNPVLQNCMFRGNAGPGVAIIGGTVQVLNSLLSGNAAAAGGGLDVSGSGSAVLMNSTITANTGAGLFVDSSGGVTATNCIFWNNSDSDPTATTLELKQIYPLAGSVTVFSSCVHGLSTFSGHNNLGQDPLFVQPLDPLHAPSGAGDFHLQACSPVVNAGNNSAVAALPLDLDGLPRIANTNVDLGCYELQTVPTTPLIITAQPQPLTNCASGLNQFSVTASGAALSYQWQVDQANGIGFVPLADSAGYSGTATPTLTISNANSALNQARFRCVVTSGNSGVAASAPALFTILPSRWYVSASAAPGGDGRSWGTAFNSLAVALGNPALDQCGSEIWVAAGTYNGGFTIQTSGALVYGGFSGTETSLNQRDWVRNPTIVDGQAGPVPGLYISTSQARVDGLIFQNAPTGISINAASPLIVNCAIRNNSGNGMSADGGSPVVSNCSFISNGSDGFLCYGASAILDHCTFQGNGSHGAELQLGTLQLLNCLSTGNHGSGASAVGTTLSIWNSTITGNAQGGAAALSSGLSLYNSICWNNNGQLGSVQNNQVYVSGASTVVACDIQGLTSPPAGWSGCFAADPEFLQPIDPASAPTTLGDFHVSACSPVRGRGSLSQLGGITTDLDGNPRLFQGTADVGAYESRATALQVTSNPTDQTGAFNTPVQFNAAANLPNATYQWQVNQGGGFSNLIDNATYSGSATATLALPAPTAALNNAQYRCQVQGVFGCLLYSSSAVFHYATILVTNSTPARNGIAPSPGAPVVLNFNQSLQASTLSDQSIAVYPMFSGRLSSSLGTIASLGVAGQVVTLNPTFGFKPGEPVFVTITKNLRTVSGFGTQPYVFEFMGAVNSSSNRALIATGQTLGANSGSDIATGDFNGDGAVDLFVASPAGDSVWINNGHGQFTPRAQGFSSSGSVAVALADVNGDGNLDAVVAKPDGTIRVLLNDGTGRFSDSGQSFGTGIRTLAAGDLNADGWLDILGAGSGSIQSFTNNGTGRFISASQTVTAGSVVSIALGDLNGDGTLDAIGVCSLGQPAKIWWNDGEGNFQDSGQALGQGDGHKVVLGDLNGDGALDAIIAYNDSPSTIWLNNGSGTLNLLIPATPAIHPGDPITWGGFPGNNHPEYAIDGDPNTDYQAGGQTLFTIIPSAGPTLVNSIRLTSSATAGFDPSAVSVYGSPSTDPNNFSFTDITPLRPIFSFTGRQQTITLNLRPNPNYYVRYRVYLQNAYDTTAAFRIAELQLLRSGVPALGGIASGLALGDINGDGKLDVVIARPDGSKEIWLNDGTAAFRRNSRLLGTGSVGPVVLADLDGNGALDLAQAGATSGSNSVALLEAWDVAGNAGTNIALSATVFSNRFAGVLGGALSQAQLASPPANGTLLLNGNPVSPGQVINAGSLANLVYVSNPGFDGLDSFAWTGTSSGGVSPNLPYYIFVQNVPRGPVLVNNFVVVSQGGTATTLTNGATSLFANALDPDGYTLTAAVLASQPAFGTATVNFDGTFNYVQNGSAMPSDSFTYQVYDSSGMSSIGTVYILPDTSLPVTAVTALPPIETSLNFNVCWSGTDADSFVRSYDIYVSTNGGPWGIWLSQVTNNCATFTAQAGQTYGFYSAGHDAAGNVEPAHSAADTTTTEVLGSVRLVSGGTNFGLHAGQFGFNVQAPPGLAVVIEASTDFRLWVPLQTNLMTSIGQFLFADVQSGRFQNRFYRARVYQGVLPQPSIITGPAALAFRTNQFGFSLTGIPGQTLVVETSTNLVQWTQMATNTLGVTPLYFSDPASTRVGQRFYRLRVL